MAPKSNRSGRFIGPQQQNGLALGITLLFLVVITLLGVTAMRSSSMQSILARNNQFKAEATQKAQAAIDYIIDTAEVNLSLESPVGKKACYVAGGMSMQACTNQLDMGSTSLFKKGIYASVKHTAPSQTPPIKSMITSADKFSVATFVIRAHYDQSEKGLGAADIEQNVIRLAPRRARVQ